MEFMAGLSIPVLLASIYTSFVTFTCFDAKNNWAL